MSAAVSIIVPCYNVAPYLDKCMESLTLQTLGDLEIICVNDGSGDDTPAILRAWAERDGRIRVVDRENGGLSAARNTGMALAGGEYIGFVDPDDYVEHSMYGRLLEKARRSDADVTACGYTGFPTVTVPYWKNGACHRKKEWKRMYRHAFFRKMPYGEGWPPWHGTSFTRGNSWKGTASALSPASGRGRTMPSG